MQSLYFNPCGSCKIRRRLARIVVVAVVLLWGSTSVADLSATFPVTTPGGTSVGSVTVQVTTVPGPPENKGITGGFTSTVPKPPPPDAKPSLAGALEQLGEHHFNWFQVVVKDNYPPAGHTPPYIDPPNGGAFGQWADSNSRRSNRPVEMGGS